MWPGNSFQALFNFQRILCKKGFQGGQHAVWTNFDSFAITCLTEVACF